MRIVNKLDILIKMMTNTSIFVLQYHLMYCLEAYFIITHLILTMMNVHC